MDIDNFVIKNQRKNYTSFTIYLKEDDVPDFKLLKIHKINISKVCRHALREFAGKLRNNNNF